MANGYIYCFSNEAMPGYYKVGMTTRTPPDRLAEANARDTWRAKPFKIEFAKKVNNVRVKERILHDRMDNYRVDRTEFFNNIPLDKIRGLFDKFEGKMWKPKHVTETPMKIPRVLKEIQDYLKPPCSRSESEPESECEPDYELQIALAKSVYEL